MVGTSNNSVPEMAIDDTNDTLWMEVAKSWTSSIGKHL